MFFLQNKIVLLLLICFTGKTLFSQKNNIQQKFEIYRNDTVNITNKDGLKQGKWIYFGKDKKGEYYSRFKRNQIIEEGYYSDNKKRGLWKYYYETGNTKSEITYVNDRPKGPVKLFDTEGKLKEGGIFENNLWAGEHYIVDSKGNKIPHPAEEPSTYLQFSGKTLKLGKAVEGVKITVIENQLEEREYYSPKDGSFSIPLYLNDEFSINFSKPGFHPQSFVINTEIYSAPDIIYYLKDWEVNLSDNTTTAATNELLGLLLNKPVNRIYFDKKKKQFDSDGKYEHFFKQQAKMIGKTGEAMLSVAMQENKRLVFENMKIEENNRLKEIELLKKNNEIQNAELSKKESEIAKQKLENEKDDQDRMLLEKETQIQKLKFQQQEALHVKDQLNDERKAREIERLGNAQKLQDLELQVNKAKLNKTTFELNSTTTELEKQTAEAVLADKKIITLNFSKKAQEEELKDQQIFTQFIGAIMAITIIFSLLLYRNFVGKKKANQILKLQAIEINFQKKVVDEKNKGITDSINYAKLIQEAILPAKEIKYKLFPDAFVLFQPKDIVSGDFYWFTEKNGKRLIATVDCTGHGVPGAFMSMIGNALLNEIINEKGVTSPSEILKQLREKVIAALKQKDSENKDGMDIAILCFDDKNNTVEFAGANNPLWLIRKTENSEPNQKSAIFNSSNGAGNTKQLIEIKGDKQPIGLYHGESQPFTNHKIQLQKGDTLYIFTDGYADQFGGVQTGNVETTNAQRAHRNRNVPAETGNGKGKKFKYKQLQNVLLETQDLPMLDQEKLLVEKIHDWKGSLEQVDDILIIGIRI